MHLLSGVVADKDSLNELTFVAVMHHPSVVAVDAVLSYHRCESAWVH